MMNIQMIICILSKSLTRQTGLTVQYFSTLSISLGTFGGSFKAKDVSKTICVPRLCFTCFILLTSVDCLFVEVWFRPFSLTSLLQRRDRKE